MRPTIKTQVMFIIKYALAHYKIHRYIVIVDDDVYTVNFWRNFLFPYLYYHFGCYTRLNLMCIFSRVVIFVRIFSFIFIIPIDNTRRDEMKKKNAVPLKLIIAYK